VDPVTSVLGGLSISLVSLLAGKYIGGNGKVKENTCKERREACENLLLSKIEELGKAIDRIESAVNRKTV